MTSARKTHPSVVSAIWEKFSPQNTVICHSFPHPKGASGLFPSYDASFGLNKARETKKAV